MKSKLFMKPTSLLIACCAISVAFLMGVVDDSYSRGGGVSRGGAASSGGFSAAAAGPADAGRAGVGGQAGVGGGPAGPAGVGPARATRMYAELPCSANAVAVDGVIYYSCGTTYYTQSYSGGSVVYVQSAPPPGF